jgi:hypothetical protein
MTRIAIFFIIITLITCVTVVNGRRRPSSSPTKTPDEEVEIDPALAAEIRKNSIALDYLKGPTPSEQSAIKAANVAGVKLKSESLLRNHHLYHKDTSKRSYPGEVLAYVTPWNKKGYNMAKIIAPKLSWLVPVWFQIRYTNYP